MALMLVMLGPPSSGSGAPDDDAFIDALREDNGDPVDRRRLARVVHAQAAALDSARGSLAAVSRPESLPPTVRDEGSPRLEARFTSYGRMLGTFQESAAALLDAPDSDRALYRALQDGQRTCWQLDLWLRLVDTYGAGGSQALSLLMPSLEACARFRTAAFAPRVERLVAAALDRGDEHGRRVAELEAELRDLEDLVDDLARIDAEP